MRYELSLLFALVFLLTGCAKTNVLKSDIAKAPQADSLSVARQYLNEITSGGLAADVYFLASDVLQGRGGGTDSEKAAAHYLASQYRLMGATPNGTVRSVDPASPENYFQPFTLHQQIPVKTTLTLADGKRSITSVFSSTTSDSLSYYMSGGAMDLTAGIVFAGYGIAADSLGFNDLKILKDKNISIDGKWLMILDDEPLKDDGSTVLSTHNRRPSVWSTQFVNKSTAIHMQGTPKGILLVRGLSPLKKTPFIKEAADASSGLKNRRSIAIDSARMPQVFGISPYFADQILKSTNITIRQLQKRIDSTLKPEAFEIPGASLKLAVEKRKTLASQNVLAFVEGSDPLLKRDVIVVTSHYDHLLPRRVPVNGDSIHNGAADDASGTAASLSMARAFMKAKTSGQGTKRSILFINFGVEENGLTGSEYYANKEHVFPWTDVVCNVNMDGVAGFDTRHPRGSKNYIYVARSDSMLTKDLIATAKKIRTALPSTVEIDEVTDFASDDRSFRIHHIPSLYFSTGLTEHYHTVDDEAHTLDYEHFARVTQLIFSTVWYLADGQKQIVPSDRKDLKVNGYKCTPCNLPCDRLVFSSLDKGCPVCGMMVMPDFSQD